MILNVTKEMLLHAAFVADEIWGDMLEPKIVLVYTGLIVPANSNLVPSGRGLRPERMFVFWFIFLCSFYFLSAFLLFALLSLGLFRVYKIRTTMDMFPVLFRCK